MPLLQSSFSDPAVVFSWELLCVPLGSVFHGKNIASCLVSMNKLSDMSTPFKGPRVQCCVHSTLTKSRLNVIISTLEATN